MIALAITVPIFLLACVTGYALTVREQLKESEDYSRRTYNEVLQLRRQIANQTEDRRAA
ncbi:hypothetical protein [Rubellicoccus peritrichatus]|uniref:Uncharacterized protein n=1 Tax=Rubellicoccus peritrichatus TaxID=3080537 RepID=A0AAQ3L6J5_9BACT|nr:hypothetical protein [Puniceicoccus sp. CR14]WOO40405.1 hypothetical protein RZN69_17435 [Puniceicoccus sp. CR14]WOO40454.1 hypothetical protein RZN69_17680 [Puniceicoccus sp. CR14]WOO40503.1 hypothetical protein RZN69_17925 [Puniceicoccus sp. CR14]WOO40553.1 hypothetical protein RZN69_18175 [Puniceicoccus sp. CR14]